MSFRRDTVVALCQQSLAFATVLAVLTPAATIVSIDVVSEVPHGRAPAGQSAIAMSAARVPVKPVDPIVHEVPLTPAKGVPVTARTRAGLAATLRRTTTGERLVSSAERVTGYGTIGVTWAHGEDSASKDLTFSVRTQTGGVWSDWMPLSYDGDHGPDAGTPEAAHARPGTDALVVGAVDNVQIKANTTGTVPDGMSLAVIDPGVAQQTAVEQPAIDTNTMSAPGTLSGGLVAASGNAAPAPAPAASTGTTGTTGTTDQVTLDATSVTAKPVIFSRAQWGADERLREPSSLHYGEVHAGFIHHTVNANGYTADQVPGIIRGIYAYHTQSRGWSDIGYNFLVDRFGRIWEGRYGGVDRPVVGAHTLGYNDWSFAMSAIGNYDITQPSSAMLAAYAKLFAWKLSLHGIPADATREWVGTRYFEAINGHRDAGQTACPGRYLYAQIPWVRQRAAALQASWAGRNLQSNLTGTPAPDLVVRRASDGRAFVVPFGGGLGFSAPRTVVAGLSGRQVQVLSPDLTGDGRPDLVVGRTSSLVALRPEFPDGTFGRARNKTTLFAGRDLITAPGDVNGDGHNDLVARDTATGRLNVYFGDGVGHFTRERRHTGWDGYNLLTGLGDANGDGRADFLARTTSGALQLLLGSGRGGVQQRIALPGSWSSADTILGGDVTGDGKPDLVSRDASGLTVVPGLGGGQFDFAQQVGPIAGLSGYAQLQTGQLGGSRAADLMGTDASGLEVLLNNGTGSGFGTPIDTGRSMAGARQIFDIGDWDRDGYGDVAALFGAKLLLYRGDGTGALAAPVQISSAFSGVSLLASVGDVTGDGYPDLQGKASNGTMTIYPGNGMSGVRTGYPAYSTINASQQIAAGLWDGDGAPDSLFRVGDQLKFYRGNGPGGLFGTPTTYPPSVAGYDWLIGVADLTGDGHPDLIARTKSSGALVLLPGSLQSGIGPARSLSTSMRGFDLAD